MKKKNLLISTICIGVFTLLYTILVAFVDKQAIGPNSSSVGFALLNNSFMELIGENGTFYTITKYTGILIILIALAYIILAIVQWCKRKSFKEIDTNLIIFSIFCVGLALIYLFFEVVKINYRPILIDGKLEASYPSSHTMLAVFICVSTAIINHKLIKNKDIRTIVSTLILCLGAITIIGRIASGVHWITDIIGAILISTTLVLGYCLTLEFLNKKQQTSTMTQTDNNEIVVEKKVEKEKTTKSSDKANNKKKKIADPETK